MFNSEVMAANIKKLRKTHELSQKTLAKLLFISAQSVSKWERGDAMPDISKLCELSDIFNVTVDSILGIDEEKQKEKILIGIDGGGTKTDFIMFSEDGIIRNRITLEGSNPIVVGIEKTCTVLKNGIEGLTEQGKEPFGIFAGIAGCGVVKHSRYVEEYLKKTYKRAVVKCDTDIFNVIGCVPEADRCAAAICGTGSVVYAYDGEKLSRIGGWGYLLDEVGSGYGIGKDVLRTALAERDGIGEKSLITGMAERILGGTVWSCIDRIYSENKDFIASFAPVAFEAYKQGDKAAEKILRTHMRHIAELLDVAADMADCGGSALMSGGLTEQKSIILEMIKESMHKPLKITVPSKPQIYGAGIQCCRMCGVDTKDFTNSFELYERGNKKC